MRSVLKLRFAAGAKGQKGDTGDPSAPGAIGLLQLNSSVYASQAEAEAGTDDEKLMTPLTTAQEIAAKLPNTAAGRGILAAADASAQRLLLELGDTATLDMADEATAVAGLVNNEGMSPLRTKQSIDANAPDAPFLTDIANPNIFPMSARDRAVLGWNLLEFIPNNLHAAILDGTTTTAVTTRIQEAFDDPDVVSITAPRGLFLIDGPLDDNTGITLRGAGRGKTIIRLPDKNLNGLCLRADNFDVRDLTVDLVHKDDTASGSCFLNFGRTNGTLMNVQAANANRQGFTADGSIRCKYIGLYAYNCGHRGVNFSGRSDYNIFTNVHAQNCGFSGFLLGFGSSYNVVQGLEVSGFLTSPGVMVHMGCIGNLIDGATISSPAGAAEPFVQVGAACTGNTLKNFKLYGVNNRGLLVRNEDMDTNTYGLVSGPTARNVFDTWDIHGTASGTITGIYTDEVVGEEHGLDSLHFKNFYIDGVANAARDVTNTGTNFQFSDFTFGAITGRKWFFSTGKGHVARNYPGLTDLASLAGATADLPAHPTYATDTPVVNTFPFPAMVCISGQAGTGAGTLIAKSGGSLVSTLVSGGNGTFRLAPGQSIEPRQGSTGTGQWRWFSVG